MPEAKKLDPDAIQDVLDDDGAELDDEDNQAAFDAGFEGDDIKLEDEPPADEPKPDKPTAAAAAGDDETPPAGETPPADDNPLAARLRAVEGKLGTVTDQLTRALSDIFSCCTINPVLVFSNGRNLV